MISTSILHDLVCAPTNFKRHVATTSLWMRLYPHDFFENAFPGGTNQDKYDENRP